MMTVSSIVISAIVFSVMALVNDRLGWGWRIAFVVVATMVSAVASLIVQHQLGG